MKRYVLTGSAKRDLDEIWIDIAERSRSIETAERMLWLLYRKILSLAKFSGTGRRCDDIDEGGPGMLEGRLKGGFEFVRFFYAYALDAHGLGHRGEVGVHEVAADIQDPAF